jgi:hypothetical protein
MIGHVMPGKQGTLNYYEHIPQQTEAYAKWIENKNHLLNETEWMQVKSCSTLPRWRSTLESD